jgi:MFS family permease
MVVRDMDAIKALAATLVGSTFSYTTVAALSFGIFIVPLSQAFGWGRGDISVTFAIMSFIVAMLAPLCGTLADRWGVRRVLFPSIVGFSLAVASLALMTQSLVHLYIAYAMVAVLGVGTTPPLYTRVIVQWFTRRRGLALGIGLSGLGIGQMLVLPLAERVIVTYGWQAAYVCLGAVTLAISLPVSWLWLHEPSQPIQPTINSIDETVDSSTSDISFKSALRGVLFWQLALGFLGVGICTSGMMAHLVPILRDRHVSPSEISLALGGMGVGFLVGRIASGALLDHFPARLVVTGCLLAGVFGIGLILLGTGGLFFTVLATILLSFAVGAELDYMAFLVRQYYGIRNYGAIYGLMFGILVIGSGSGPVIMGYGHQYSGDYGQMMWILFIISIIAVIPFSLLPKSKISRHSSPVLE